MLSKRIVLIRLGVGCRIEETLTVKRLNEGFFKGRGHASGQVPRQNAIRRPKPPIDADAGLPCMFEAQPELSQQLDRDCAWLRLAPTSAQGSTAAAIPSPASASIGGLGRRPLAHLHEQNSRDQGLAVVGYEPFPIRLKALPRLYDASFAKPECRSDSSEGNATGIAHASRRKNHPHGDHDLQPSRGRHGVRCEAWPWRLLQVWQRFIFVFMRG